MHMSAENQNRLYQSFEKKAEKIIDNNEKTSKLLDEALFKVENISKGPVDEVWDHVILFVELMKDWITGKYRNMPIGSIIMIVATLLYFCSKKKRIPKFILGMGYIDDIAMISFTFRQIQTDIDKYLVWRNIRDINSSI